MKRIICTIIVLVTAAAASAAIINIPADWPTIQQGIDASVDGDTVLVQPGIYYENINFIGRAIVVGSLYLTTGDTSYMSSTIIDGRAQNSVIIFESGEDNTTEIVGFTIRNGQARPYGGGIYCFYSGPIIRNNRIMDNHAEGPSMDSVYWGGGIACISSNAVITNNIISGNTADIRAGVFCERASPTITYNIICNNSVANYGNTDLSGGGLSIGGGNPLVAYNIIRDNYGGWSGGGVLIDGLFGLLYGNLIIGNSADNVGGGVVIEGLSYPKLINNVIYNNIADGSSHVSMGGGIAILFNSYPILINNILWGDSADYDHEIHFFEASAIIQYSNIEGGYQGFGNIDLDPLFRDPENGDFHLMSIACGDSADSPCIDAGDPDILDSLLDCSRGLGDTRSDMGAYGGGDSLITAIFDNVPSLPDRFMLLQNYPNPFNARTTIRFVLPKSQEVQLNVYDILGRRVETLIDEYIQAGAHTVTYDAFGHSSGVYFYRLQAGDRIESKRMLLLK